jgi:hypothetical protein
MRLNIVPLMQLGECVEGRGDVEMHIYFLLVSLGDYFTIFNREGHIKEVNKCGGNGHCAMI